MFKNEYQYVDNVALKKINETLNEFYRTMSSPEDFLDRLKEALPVHQLDDLTWKKRLEGFFEVSERLFYEISSKVTEINSEKWNRQKIINETKIKSFNFYQNINRKRNVDHDNNQLVKYFNAPYQALIKLEDDIMSLVKLYHLLDINHQANLNTSKPIQESIS